MVNASLNYLKLHETEYVEEPFLQQLEGLGWDIIRLSQFGQQAKDSYRDDFNEVLLTPVFYQSLLKINPWLEDDQLDEIKRLLNVGLSGNRLLDNNQAILHCLLENTLSASNRHTVKNTSISVQLIDFESPENNTFTAISQLQLRILGTERSIFPDIVLFINGLPIGVVECKSPKAQDPIAEAIDQLMRYSELRGERGEGCPALFYYNQILIVTDRLQAKFGTLTTQSEKHFYRWSDPYPRNVNDLEHGNAAPCDQQRLVAGMLDKHNLLAIMRTFTLFSSDDKGKMIKVVGRYQQFRAVKVATQRLLEGKNRDERGGIIWHTQGSGKSLTMMFMVREMYRHVSLSEWKIIFITDRTQLEEQLAETSQHIGFTVKVANSVKHLKKLLVSDSSDVVMAMIHKFQDSDFELTFPVLNKDSRILIMTDEAHRSQYSKLGANLDKALPNATRIGYTGTPIDKTEKLFGDYIDKYTMKQAITDGVTLEIIYEGRTHQAEVSNAGKMDAAFKDVFADYSFDKRLQILGYGTARAYLESEVTIQAKAEDMLQHYLSHIFSAGFKAQIVATSRKAAVRYKTAIEAALVKAIKALEQDNPNQLNLQRLKKLTTAVIISAKHNDLPHLKKHTQSKDHKAAIKSFKLDFDSEDDDSITGNVGIVIVNNMLLTGFDAPIEQVMYLDKVIIAHNLLQAIARVNRVSGVSKDKGFVVDYVGVGHHLKKALEVYDEKEQKEISASLSSLDDELRNLDKHFKAIKALFKQHGLTDWEDFEAFYNVFYDEEIRFKFIDLFKQVTRSLNNLYPNKAALTYVEDYQKLASINFMAGKHCRDKRLSMKGIPDKLRAITDTYLRSKGIDTKVKPISILDADFATHSKKNKRTKTQAAEVEHALRHHLEVSLDEQEGASLAAELEQILSDFAGNWDKIYKALEKLREKIKNSGQEPTYGLHRKKQLPFFSLLKRQFFKAVTLNDEQMSVLVDLTQELFNAIERELKLTGFWDTIAAKNQLRAELLRILSLPRFADLPSIFEDEEKITSNIMELAYKNNPIILSAD